MKIKNHLSHAQVKKTTTSIWNAKKVGQTWYQRIVQQTNKPKPKTEGVRKPQTEESNRKTEIKNLLKSRNGTATVESVILRTTSEMYSNQNTFMQIHVNTMFSELYGQLCEKSKSSQSMKETTYEIRMDQKIEKNVNWLCGTVIRSHSKEKGCTIFKLFMHFFCISVSFGTNHRSHWFVYLSSTFCKHQMKLRQHRKYLHN